MTVLFNYILNLTQPLTYVEFWRCLNRGGETLPPDVVHNQIQSNDVSHCFHFYLLWLENNTRQQTTFLFKIVLRCNLSWFLSTPSIWLCYSILSKTQGRNKCIIGVIYLSGWVMRDIYRWLYHSVSAPVSDRRSSTSCNEKKSAVQSNLIYSQEAGCHHDLQFLSLKHVPDWHQLRKKTEVMSVTVIVRFFKCHQGQDVCF